jgi:hypothetical protein
VTPPQTIEPATEDNFSTLTDAPQGETLGVWGERLVIGSGTTIHMSDINDPEVWEPLPNNNAFEKTFTSGGRIMGFSNSNNPIIVQERAILRGSLVGAPTQVVFDTASDGIGTDHPYSIARFGSALFFWSNTGFVQVAPDGAITNIGADKIDRWFLNAADLDRRIQGWPDIVGRRVFWAYHTPAAGAPNFDAMLCYDLATQQWSRASLKIAELAGVAFSATLLESLDMPLEEIEGSLDDGSTVYVFGAIDRDGKAGTFTGPPLRATITTAEFPQSGAGRTRMNWAMPQVDADEARISVFRRERRGQAFVEGSTVVHVSRTGLAPLRDTGRFFRLQLRIPAGYVWTWATGIEVDAQPEGRQ